MKLTAKADIAAPIDLAFEGLRDPDRLEQTVRARGGSIRRNPAGPMTKGTQWDARIAFRGASRHVNFIVTRLDAPKAMRFQGNGAAFDITVDVELAVVGASTTLLTVTTQGEPRTLPARIMMQSLKLAHGQMLARYRAQVVDYVAELESDLRLS